MLKYVRSLIFGAVLSAGVGSCAPASEWRTSEGSVWNTTFKITYRAPADLSDSILAVMREVELSLSPFNPRSRVSLINRGESDAGDSLILRVFDISRKVSAASGGRFDPTVSPLVNLWGFGYEGKGDGAVPTDAQIDSALALVGIRECRIDGGLLMVKKSPGTTFNFSAVTKGFGCDMVGEMLRRNGADSYMVEIGGELALAGRNPRGDKWHIQVDAPVADRSGRHTPLLTIAVADCGVASSGNYRNFHSDASGRRFGHTIDPVTGRPFQGDVIAATVVAPDCATADALATACMASPSDDAAGIIRAFPASSALLVVASADSLVLRPVGDFPLRKQ